jgi:hypothetical protein
VIRSLYRYTSQQGRAGPIYGHDDTYEGLGIFFDTFEDAENGTAEPFVVAMMNYGKPIGEGDTPDYYDNQVGVCFASYRNLPNMMAARIVWSDGRLQARDCHVAARVTRSTSTWAAAAHTAHHASRDPHTNRRFCASAADLARHRQLGPLPVVRSDRERRRADAHAREGASRDPTSHCPA